MLVDANSVEVPNVMIDRNAAGRIFDLFKDSKLFGWKDGNNCEDRANAVSLVLDSWGIPNMKVWIFSGDFLDRGEGRLMTVNDPQNENKSITWKFHVASALPYKQDNEIKFVVLDPAILSTAGDVDTWAQTVTVAGPSYYFLTTNKNYMWNKKGRDLNMSTFNRRAAVNFEWTIEGLAGYNGLNDKHKRFLNSDAGRAKIRQTKEDFERLKATMPNLN